MRHDTIESDTIFILKSKSVCEIFVSWLRMKKDEKNSIPTVMNSCELVSGRVFLAQIYTQKRTHLHAFDFSKSNEFVVIVKKCLTRYA